MFSKQSTSSIPLRSSNHAAKLNHFNRTSKHMRNLFLIILLNTFYISVHAQSACTTVARMPTLSPVQKEALTKNLDTAIINYRRDTNNADAIIWYGRRTAYLGNYAEAISIFTKGIAKFPKDARFYRHRGHRYLTLRCLHLAIPDFEKAAQLISNKPDEMEPDGAPNAKNIPTSTLQSNIWYHLGLAYYLKGDFVRASEAYQNCLRVSKNPDMYVATANWLYITLKKLKKEEEAAKLLSTISADMNLIENKDYLRLLLIYKGQVDPAEVKKELMTTSASLSNASSGYGLANYYWLKGDRQEAESIFDKVLSGDQWASFGYIATELRKKD